MNSTIYRYVRRRSQRVGVVLAKRIGNEIFMGWSLCNAADKFDKTCALKIADDRTLIACPKPQHTPSFPQHSSRQPNDSIVTPSFGNDVNTPSIPHSLLKEYYVMANRALRYFKNCQLAASVVEVSPAVKISLELDGIGLNPDEVNLLTQLIEKYKLPLNLNEPIPIMITSLYSSRTVGVSRLVKMLYYFLEISYQNVDSIKHSMHCNGIKVSNDFFDRAKYLMYKLDRNAYETLVD